MLGVKKNEKKLKKNFPYLFTCGILGSQAGDKVFVLGLINILHIYSMDVRMHTLPDTTELKVGSHLVLKYKTTFE